MSRRNDLRPSLVSCEAVEELLELEGWAITLTAAEGDGVAGGARGFGTTDRAGRARIARIPPGRYSARFAAPLDLWVEFLSVEVLEDEVLRHGAPGRTVHLEAPPGLDASDTLRGPGSSARFQPVHGTPIAASRAGSVRPRIGTSSFDAIVSSSEGPDALHPPRH